MTDQTLYRFWAKSKLLYVGISINAFARASAHRRGSEWWPLATRVTFEHFPDRAAVLRAESLAIRSEHPQFNIRHNSGATEMNGLVAADGYMTIEGVMAKTYVPRNTLNKLRREGKGPKWTTQAKTILYKREWIDEWLAASVRVSTAA